MQDSVFYAEGYTTGSEFYALYQYLPQIHTTIELQKTKLQVFSQYFLDMNH